MVESIVREPAVVTPEETRSDERAAVELSLLLEAIVRWGGYDFREYSPALIKRRVFERMRAEDVQTISGLQEKLLHDREALRRFIFAMSSSATKLFKAPEYFKAFRERVVPFLRTYSFVRLWFPACSTGEDVYTVACILHEEGLLDRCMMYATDMSELALQHARDGIFEIGSVEEFANDYRLSGGHSPLARYCRFEDEKAIFNDEIRQPMIFSTHSLAQDSSLNEFHCIMARGVLPQFSKSLQYRVHNLFLQSLARFGFLCLSSAETLHATPHEGVFRKVDEVFPVYRRMR
ncbi:MAG TPA: CheR family methyltransferase [Candidatus Baltobacteraceae bacterium]|nr:CheR family methyltransferase [Candidatus Baltobacteraceae bacterium]